MGNGVAIKIDKFNGLLPRISTRLLPENAAQVAENINLKAGRLELATAQGGGSPSDAWKQKILDGNDAVLSPINEDTLNRYYWTPPTGGLNTNFGSVSIAAPGQITGVTISDIFSYSGLTCTWNGGTYHGTQACALQNTVRKQNGYEFRFRMTGSAYESESQPIGQISHITYSFNHATLGDVGIGDQVPLTYNGKNYATWEITKISTDNVDNDYDPQVTTEGNFQSIVKPHDIVVEVTMNYTADVSDRYYIRTNVDAATGAEGPPSVVSEMITLKPGQKVVLSGLTAGQKIYRSATGGDRSGFFYLGIVGTTTFEDTKADADLAEELGVYGNPPSGIKGLVLMAGGFMAAFKGRDLYFSEPFLPHKWPSEYNMTVEYDIVGLATSGRDLIVLTKGHPIYITGAHPEYLTQSIIPLAQSCTSKSSICSGENVVFHASPDGIVMIQGNTGRLVTDQYFTRTQWQDLEPTSMLMEIHDKKLFVFTDSASDPNYIFDIKEGLAALTTTTQTASQLFNDIEDDTLYGPSGSISSFKWRSKEFKFNRPLNFAAARVVADDYPVTFKLYSNEESAPDIEFTVQNDESFRLKDVRPEKVWSIGIESAYAVDEVQIGTVTRLIK